MLSNSSAILYRNLSRNIRLWSTASTQCLRLASVRQASTMSGANSFTRSPRARAVRFGSVAATVAVGTSGLLFFRPIAHLDSEDEGGGTGGHARSREPLSSLIRSYIVYSMCSIPALVDASPTLLSYFLSIPIIRDIAEGVVRITFFNQFVGGDTAEEALPLVDALRKENKGALFAYSVEVDEDEAAAAAGRQTHSNARSDSESTGEKPVHKQIVDEMIRCIDVSADFEDHRALMEGRDMLKGRRTWVAVKFTALVPSALSLVAYSSHIIRTRPTPPQPIAFPGCPIPSDLTILDVPDNKLDEYLEGSPLSRSDVIALRELRSDLERICERAQERHVKVIIDAEYTWYQPAIDALTLSLMRKFNKLPSSSPVRRSWFSRIVSRTSNQSLDTIQPLVYTTYQCYLRRTPDFLRQSIADAQAGGYALGVKLVRGAYHSQELSTFYSAKAGDETSPSISPDNVPPVWLSKHETDLCYNELTKMLIKRLADNIHSGKEISSPPLPQLGILFGTHNWHSCDLVLDQLVTHGLAKRERDVIEIIPDEVVERVAVAQLYGMKDELTNSIVDRTKASVPFVIKYIPYGALKDVMPYLSRRAIENKSVLGDGGAVEERKRAGAEIMRRIFPRFL